MPRISTVVNALYLRLWGLGLQVYVGLSEIRAQGLKLSELLRGSEL